MTTSNANVFPVKHKTSTNTNTKVEIVIKFKFKTNVKKFVNDFDKIGPSGEIGRSGEIVIRFCNHFDEIVIRFKRFKNKIGRSGEIVIRFCNHFDEIVIRFKRFKNKIGRSGKIVIRFCNHFDELVIRFKTEHDRGHEQAEMVRLRLQLRLNMIADTNKLLKPFCKGENDFVKSSAAAAALSKHGGGGAP